MKNYKKNIVYVVTKGSSNGIFQEGDYFWISKNGNVNILQARGWLTKDEFLDEDTCNFEAEVSEEYELNRIGKIRPKLRL